jgi:valyl-tRNA synthetase
VTEIRKIRRDQGLNPKEKLSVQIGTTQHAADLQAGIEVMKTMANLETLVIGAEVNRPEHCAVGIIDGVEIIVEVPFDPEAEKKRLTKENSELEKQVANLKGRLSNKSYTDKAPDHLVQQTRDALSAAEEKQAKLVAELKAL